MKKSSVIDLGSFSKLYKAHGNGVVFAWHTLTTQFWCPVTIDGVLYNWFWSIMVRTVISSNYYWSCIVVDEICVW